MRDDIIIFEGTEVSLRAEAQEFKAFVELLDADTSKRKGLYKAQLKYLYYVYTKSSPFHDRYTPLEREALYFEQVETKYEKNKIKTFELKNCIPVIRRHTMLRSEAQLEGVLEDFDRLVSHINSIPWEREVTKEIQEGKKITTKSYIESNSDEKLKAIKNLKDLLELQKSIEKIVKDERKKEAAGGGKKRIFEDPESLEDS